jgi:hypothetical protein
MKLTISACLAGAMLVTSVSHVAGASGATPPKISGSTANEIFATEALAGIPPDGAAGSNFESLTKLSCTIDPNAIRQKDGSGADCTFQPAK